MLLAATLLAVVQAAAASATPDIEINARVRAREVHIEQQGRAEARVTIEPSAGRRIEVERNLPKGQAQYRNLDLRLHVEGRIAGPDAGVSASAAGSAEAEPSPEPQPEPPTGD